jgi:HSP20 family protein
MTLVRWEPVRELDSLQGEMNRLFDTFFGNGNGNGKSRRWVPAMDLVETEEHLVLRADLPGMSREDVAIEVKDRTLFISGERKDEHSEKVEGYYRFERSFGSFSRTLTLPDGISAEAIEADFDKGVLEIRIPKPAERKPHRIEIGTRSAEGKTAIEGSAEEK